MLLVMLCLVLLSSTCLADNPARGDDKKVERLMRFAEDSYAKKDYRTGIGLYIKAHELAPEDHTIVLAIAEGYFLIKEYESAARWYGKSIHRLDLVKDAVHFLNFGEVLIAHGRYSEAEKWFAMYQKSSPDDRRAFERLAGLMELKNFYKDSLRYHIEPVKFNSDGHDFSPTYHGEKIVFVSSRKLEGMGQWVKSEYSWNNTNFLNLMIADPSGNVELFNKSIRTDYHEGPAAFFDDGNKIMFTRNNFSKSEIDLAKLKLQGSKVRKNKQGEVLLKLYCAEKDSKGKWSSAQEIALNSNDFSTGHPTLSSDGTRMYFASDRKGGHGKSDIYLSVYKNGHWARPHNLGKQINTEGAEMFPYIDEYDFLYFASDGHGGLGGLDIYAVDLKDPDARPRNMGYPLNSSYDDFGIIVKEEVGMQTGYFSSNRPGGKGLDDIYQFQYITSINLPGKVLDDLTGEPIALADVGVSDISHDDHRMDIVHTNAQGIFEYEFRFEDDHYIAATKPGFNRDTLRIFPSCYIGDTIELRIKRNLLITGTITDRVKGDTLDAVRVIVTNEDTQTKFGMVTKKDGHYSFVAKPYTNYSFQVKKHKYFTHSANVFTGDKESGVIIHDAELEELFVGKPIVLDDIHYDLGRSDIREDAGKELDKFAKQLHDNPEIIVELSTHTDSRGDSKSNLSLSDKRAKAAAGYVIDHGIHPRRIVGKGYGEAMLINDCTDNVACTEFDHQQNRRAEFKVTGFLPHAETEEEKGLVWIEPEFKEASLDRSNVVHVSYKSEKSKVLKGYVHDRHGVPLVGALITLQHDGHEDELHLKTDDHGEFSVKIYPNKYYELIVEAIGHIQIDQRFMGFEVDQLEFALKREGEQIGISSSFLLSNSE